MVRCTDYIEPLVILRMRKICMCRLQGRCTYIGSSSKYSMVGSSQIQEHKHKWSCLWQLAHMVKDDSYGRLPEHCLCWQDFDNLWILLTSCKYFLKEVVGIFPFRRDWRYNLTRVCLSGWWCILMRRWEYTRALESTKQILFRRGTIWGIGPNQYHFGSCVEINDSEHTYNLRVSLPYRKARLWWVKRAKVASE